MGVVIDKILGEPLLHDHPVRLVSSDPATAKDGTVIFNTTDFKYKMYYSGIWFTVADISLQMILDESGTPLLDENNVILQTEI